ncbi:uncharacterized protein ASCRUDRAFT_80150 [Ascoidea rubescens DSM 1968]|uniref:Uncharacterized protein n=1 Tax=Ascoidea rubescens DSM 1968 TaxID=1344418 RepID=A0A1D2VJD7_9ASCO|nr:hypothetical protein ASCRUDRAFT_80150 [Ascoidea rubescens DSM 1968]ODV61736.1 hypothetical protein ASCRUDRAFT_80150 [Ascoidea rubescens DSM 1968]
MVSSGLSTFVSSSSLISINCYVFLVILNSLTANAVPIPADLSGSLDDSSSNDNKADDKEDKEDTKMTAIESADSTDSADNKNKDSATVTITKKEEIESEAEDKTQNKENTVSDAPSTTVWWTPTQTVWWTPESLLTASKSDASSDKKGLYTTTIQAVELITSKDTTITSKYETVMTIDDNEDDSTSERETDSDNDSESESKSESKSKSNSTSSTSESSGSSNGYSGFLVQKNNSINFRTNLLVTFLISVIFLFGSI